MPATRREYLKRRCRQTDHSLAKAQHYLATIYRTVMEQHPELGPEVFALIGAVDGCRRALLLYARRAFSSTSRGLWKSADMDRIVDEAQPVPDPHYEY